LKPSFFDRALLQRRIDVAAGDLLRNHAELAHDAAGEAADPHLEAFEIVGRLDFAAEPAAHLRAGVADRQVVDVVALVELVEQVVAAGLEHPGVHLARVHAEWNRGGEGECLVLAEIVVAGGVAALDRLVLNAVHHLQRRHELAGRVRRDVELAVGGRADAVAEHFGAAVDRVERLREARCEPPLDRRHRLRDGRLGKRGHGRRRGDRAHGARAAEELTSFHERGLPVMKATAD